MRENNRNIKILLISIIVNFLLITFDLLKMLIEK
jgi:hypothetical protein